MISVPQRGPTTPHMHCYTHGLGSSPFARHYWGNHCLFSLPAGTKMFQFPAFASLPCVKIAALQAAGLSHSEIPGSKVICTYPGLIAAYHVLHRLREPRHPPDALTCFRHNEKLKNEKIEKLKSSTLQFDNSSILIAHTFSCN